MHRTAKRELHHDIEIPQKHLFGSRIWGNYRICGAIVPMIGGAFGKTLRIWELFGKFLGVLKDGKKVFYAKEKLQRKVREANGQ